MCGDPRSETFDPENDHAYEAEPWVCHKCAAIARGEESWSKQGGKSHGVYFTATKREG